MPLARIKRHNVTMDDFRCIERVRVRWAEVDMQNVVFNAHYQAYFDLAMAAYWRRMAVPYHGLMVKLGGDQFVKQAKVEYLAPARYFDTLDVGIRCVHIGKSSVIFEGAVLCEERVLAKCERIQVYVDQTTRRPTPVPEELRGLCESFEEGKRLLTPHLEACDPLSMDVPLLFKRRGTYDSLAQRERTHHLVLHNLLGDAVAAATLAVHDENLALDYVVVEKELSGSGIGRYAMEEVSIFGRSRNCSRVLVPSPPRHVHGFFSRLGFARTGGSTAGAGTWALEI